MIIRSKAVATCGLNIPTSRSTLMVRVVSRSNSSRRRPSQVESGHMSEASREKLLMPWQAGIVLVLLSRRQTIGGSVISERPRRLM
jgi:hypothetical protein